MVFQMNHVILDQVTEGHRLVAADSTLHSCLLIRDAAYHLHDMSVVEPPEIDHLVPIVLDVSLASHPVILLVARADQRLCGLTPNEPLVVVRCGVYQVTKDFLSRPLVG